MFDLTFDPDVLVALFRPEPAAPPTLGPLVIPEPGSTSGGPCETPCAHAECADAMATAAEVCGLCPDPIGFGAAYRYDDEHGTVHADCLADRYDSLPIDGATPAAEADALAVVR
jgi:hypothetical protein